ncbi:MAG: 5-formyltetrahydrofolate cyclo-ligase [Pseudomonadota bacterium]
MRKAAFAARKLAHAADLDRAANRNLQNAIASFPGSRVVAGYMPIQTEVSPLPTMNNLYSTGTTVVVPVIVGEGQALRWAEWAPHEDMVEGAFKALIPARPNYLTPDLIIAPLVAFDGQGGRLGYGGGFYDRSLELLRATKPTPAIGFAYSAQELADLPLETTDQPLDMIVTETNVTRFPLDGSLGSG